MYAGKHFTTAPPKDGKTVDTYFHKHHEWISAVRGRAPGIAYIYAHSACLGHTRESPVLSRRRLAVVHRNHY